MEFLKKQIQLSGESSLFLLSNTIVLIPYILFIQLSDGVNVATILPFVLFYTFRMTGIFLIRGIRNTIDSLKLLRLSLLLGGAGSFLGMIAAVYSPLYIISGILLGLSGAWLPMTNTSVKMYEKEFGKKKKTSVSAIFILTALLLCAMVIGGQNKGVLIFFVYLVYYIFAGLSLKGHATYLATTESEDTFSKKDLGLFLLFFCLLLFLRSGRLLTNATEFDYSILGVSLFFLLFVLGINSYWKKRTWKVSSSLNFVTLINGIVGNYLFLFGSLYITGVYGRESLATYLYAPYALGMIFAMALSGRLIKHFGEKTLQLLLLGLLGGLLVMMVSQLVIAGIFFLSFFKSVLNSWLTQRYYSQKQISQDKRLWIKYSTQNKGSIAHQFFLMTLLFSIVHFEGNSTQALLAMTSTQTPTEIGIQVMSVANYISTGMIAAGIILYFVLFKKRSTKGLPK